MVWPEDFVGVELATVLGAVIGLERQLSGKPAGLRTNLLICLGAAVFTIISREMAVGGEMSLTRIAAQIVSGVGFLGAGAIIQDRGGVHGLTTAATIWLVASIGMACGGQFYMLALVATVDCDPGTDRPGKAGEASRSLREEKPGPESRRGDCLERHGGARPTLH